MFNGPVRGGTRGGQAEFKWADVSADKDRENYLGHSINAPTGRWQKNKDVHWYARENKTAEQEAADRREEIKKIKEAEEDALAVALGFKAAVRGPQTGGPQTGANAEPVAERPTPSVAPTPAPDSNAKALEKEERQRRKEEKRRRKEERRARKEARRQAQEDDNSVSPSRSASPPPARDHDRRERGTPPSRYAGRHEVEDARWYGRRSASPDRRIRYDERDRLKDRRSPPPSAHRLPRSTHRDDDDLPRERIRERDEDDYRRRDYDRDRDSERYGRASDTRRKAEDTNGERTLDRRR